ncbi:MAG: hypothetical protein Q7S76_02940 [bacterium]|nr:hypothetical protein [bacterium]
MSLDRRRVLKGMVSTGIGLGLTDARAEGNDDVPDIHKMVDAFDTSARKQDIYVDLNSEDRNKTLYKVFSYPGLATTILDRKNTGPYSFLATFHWGPSEGTSTLRRDVRNEYSFCVQGAKGGNEVKLIGRNPTKPWSLKIYSDGTSEGEIHPDILSKIRFFQYVRADGGAMPGGPIEGAYNVERRADLKQSCEILVS